jgi:hypothetical protein
MRTSLSDVRDSLMSSRIKGRMIPRELGRSYGKSLVLLTGRYDCGSCVTAALDVLNRADSLAAGVGVGIALSVIATDSLAAERLRLYSNWRLETVLIDEADKVRSSLGFISTPAILVVDTSSMIVDVHFPRPDSDERSGIGFSDSAILVVAGPE